MYYIRVITFFVLLITGFTSSWAQSEARYLNPALASTAVASGSQPSVPIFSRWVDEHGRVHYGDMSPSSNAAARNANVGSLRSPAAEQKTQPQVQAQAQTQPQPQAQAPAQTQLQHYRAESDQPVTGTPQAVTPPASPVVPSSPTATYSGSQQQFDSCAQQWMSYTAAAACVNQYRVIGVGLKDDAQNCLTVLQPQCDLKAPH
jgi:hypothetical protein